ncbi:MAG: tRNA (adenosine(37)-N6)-threonylcarbamoyltransferase complex transferase subunit TsaD [Clostridia bacterium]|nr:tRNA (adenosine(37)-N6)-threonylcarbamoyltransferase complex transferase subunit TsaD [Clostridia bacterium]
MIILAIESSCDETAAAVTEFRDGVPCVLSSVVASQIDTHALYGGVVPEIASRAHAQAISAVVEKAISDSGVPAERLDAVGVTFAPGLIGSLLVGVCFAKALAYDLGIPLIPVNHIEAHVAAAYAEYPDLSSPFLALVVSGGHTSLYDVPGESDFREIGSTRDDAAGEAFDKIGRVMGLPYPGGAAMDRLASAGKMRPDRFPLPSPAIPGDSLDFSFSGLKTAALNRIHQERQLLSLSESSPLPDRFRETMAASFTEVVVDGICQKTALALKETERKTLVVSGGVAANSHLRKALETLTASRNVRLAIPSVARCGDNAVMTACQAYYDYKNGTFAPLSLNAFASDELAISEHLSMTGKHLPKR